MYPSESIDLVYVDEPVGQFLEGIPFWDIVLPAIVTLSDDDDRYVERFNQSKDGYVWGLDGDDYILTRSFGVSIDAGKGDDTIVWAYQPPKLIDGGEGVDTLDLSMIPRGVKVDLNMGYADTHVPLFTSTGPVEVRNIENVIGSDFNDQIIGSAADNILMGGAGADILVGLSGNDELHGGSSPNGERDVLIGGNGADKFVFNTAEEGKPQAWRDVVVDFEQGTDMLAFHTTLVVSSIEFRAADREPSTEFIDPGQSYLFVDHSSQPGMPQTTEVQMHLADGLSHEYAAITLVGHHDLTPGDFMFV